MIVFTVINIIVLVVNIFFTLKKRFPKWEYYKEGIRFYNKDNKVTIEYDKPLR